MIFPKVILPAYVNPFGAQTATTEAELVEQTPTRFSEDELFDLVRKMRKTESVQAAMELLNSKADVWKRFD